MNDRLEYLEIQITDSCNLNCKGCSHCAGLFEKNRHIPVENFQKDIERFHMLIPQITKIRLLGGEPFLNPRLEEYIVIVREFYPDSDIRITTNGTLCLNYRPELYDMMRKLDIGLDISVYPPTSVILEKLKRMLDACKIRYECTEEIRQFVKRIDLKGDSEINSAFWDCNSKWCNFLRDGVLSICPAPVILDILADYYHLDIHTQEGKMDIYEPSLTAEQIISFLNSPNPVCRYCTKMEYFQWKANKTPELNDWIIERE